MKSFLRTLADRRMFLLLCMGFVSGLPLPLIGGALKVWLSTEEINIATIGAFALVGLPQVLKFVWSPIFDRFQMPFLGRRRGWVLVLQIGLMLALVGISTASPTGSIEMIAFWAVMISFLSASQDIVLDAYRWEILKPEEYGLGTSTFVTGYRIALLVGGTFALILADPKVGGLPWSTVYQLMGLLFLIGIASTLVAKEPTVSAPPPKNIRESVIDPFVDYLKRPGALWMLGFIMLYKLGDNIAAELAWPFYQKIGYALSIIGTVSKAAGFVGTVGGAFVGGAMVLRIGLLRSLWICGIFQAASTLGFAWLAWLGRTGDAGVIELTAVVLVENITAGMGTSAFLAFMGNLTNKKYTATQYALLSSLMAVPRVIMGSTSGVIAASLGWEGFFTFCAVAALPGLLVLLYIGKWVQESPEKT